MEDQDVRENYLRRSASGRKMESVNAPVESVDISEEESVTLPLASNESATFVEPLPPRKKKKNVPVRKRLKHMKRKKKEKDEVTPTAGLSGSNASPSTSSNASSTMDFESLGSLTEENVKMLECDSTPTSPFGTPALADHDYFSQSPSPSESCSPSPCSSRPGSSLSGLSLSISVSDFSEDSCGFLSPTSPAPSSSFSAPIASTPLKNSKSTSEPHLQDKEHQSSNMRLLLLDVRDKLVLMLPDHLLPCVSSSGISVLMVGRRESKAVQRQVFVSTTGSVDLEVHGKDYPANVILKGVREQKPLTEENTGYFTDRIVEIVSNLRLLEICAGMDAIEFREAWASTPQGEVEEDIYKECKYRETFRSKKCFLLVESKTWRCKECTKMKKILQRKLESMTCEEPSKFTNNRYLTDMQKDSRLASKQKTIRNKQQKIDRMQQKIKEMIAKEGVNVERNQSKDFLEILQSSDMSPTQSLFLQQQLKAASCKKRSGMRWHPVLIRLALSIYLKAPGAYKDLCNSGFVKLPSSRTLFDYSHITRVEPGIDKTIIETVANRASSNEKKLKHKQYHVLMADEMHLSKNLVLLKSSGDLIGFKDLDNLDKEIATLESYLDNPDEKLEPELASKVMAFMVKGVSSKLKHVVASYPVVNPSPKQMYYWTWDVIGALERSGVRVIAFICDGCATNRAFIKLHNPVSVVPSGVVFDTVNKFVPERCIFFFSDVPHLLKTMRNAFFNSRLRNEGQKKSFRLLKKNGETIVWDTIIRLYLAKKDQALRKSYKLNAQNVFPDSYSRMKVKLAAEIWSRSVGTDILSQGWPRTRETVDLILKVNDWFDLLNGAFSTQGAKKNNRRLNPYTMQDIKEFEQGVEGNRFQELLDFLKYLDDWKGEAEANMNASLAASAMLEDSRDLGVRPLDDGSFHALEDTLTEAVEDNEHYSKHIFPHQTLLGIEMSTRAFIAATTFILKEGISFINARVYCQDPLEQNFGRHRMAGGGSQAPNFYQLLHKQRGFSIIGELSASRSTGNTEVIQETSEVEISSDPLPKRKKIMKQIEL